MTLTHVSTVKYNGSIQNHNITKKCWVILVKTPFGINIVILLLFILLLLLLLLLLLY